MAKSNTPRETSNLPVNYIEQLQNEASTIAAKISAPSGDRIRMVGSQKFVLPDGTEAAEIEGVVVDFMSANLFFEGAFDPKNPAPPGCFAVGPEPSTLVPTNNSPNKQAETCAVCPNNQFGSNGAGKACKNTRLLAIQPLEGGDHYVLSVPPTSIKEFDKYVSTLAAKHRMPPIGVLTKVTLDHNVTYSAPRFDIVRPLTNEEIGPMMEGRLAARERLVAEPDFSQYRGAPKPQARGPIARR